MSTWQNALTRLATDSGQRLLRTAYLICGDASMAEDLVQEAFVRCFSRRSSRNHLIDLTGPDIPVTGAHTGRGAGAGAEAYLRTTMVNIVIDMGRRRNRWRDRSHLFVTPTPLDHAAGVDDRVDLLAALEQLSPRQRVCVVLRYYEDLTVAQIATELDLAEGTIKRHLHDGIARLRTTVPAPVEPTPLEGDPT